MTTGRKISSSEEETRRIAREFGRMLKPGDVVALSGELGSGKTQFVKGVCEAFGVRAHVSSPTFVMVHRYEGRTQRGEEILVYHFDLYRIISANEVLDLGYEEFLFGDGIALVEWAERLRDLLPEVRYDVHCELGETESERVITIARTTEEVLSGGGGSDQ